MVKMDSSKRKNSEITYEEVLLMKKSRSDGPHLLDFSDCVLTLILSNLDSYDLYRLSKTCSRFRYLIKERKLWKKLDIVSHPMCAKKYEFFFENLNNTTDTVLVSGISKKEKTLTSFQCHKMFGLCNNLTILAIENQYINSDEVRLNQFPKTLKELSLRGTHISGKQPFLQDAHKKLENLHTLILDDCKWFHEHSLMALSKLLCLENLSLYNCRNLNDSIAYMSVTARFGFTKLLRIDARCTPIGDQFLKCFHVIKTLREVYLESPPMSPNKRGSLFEEIKRWCTSNMQSVPNVVIFNESTVNTVFKRNRNIKRHYKYAKKNMQRSEPSSQISKPTLFKGSHFNCLENCDSCSIETCATFKVPVKFPSPKKPEKRKDTSVLSLNIINTDSETNQNNEISIGTNSQEISIDASNREISIDIRSDSKEGSSNKELNVDENKPEMLYCDDVSDSDDELDFAMFRSDVTDAGVQWFGTHDPQSVDTLGNQSFLFRKPYRKCDCDKKPKTEPIPVLDISEPGPSGLNQPGPSTSGNRSKRSTPFKTKALEVSETQPTSRPSVVVKRKKCRLTEPPSCPEPKRPCPEKPSLTVDLDIGEGHPVHLEIISENVREQESEPEKNESSDTDENSANNEKSQNENDDSSGEESTGSCTTCESDIVLRQEPAPPREENEVRNRDLRVIIERLDPGLHIVIDRAGRIQFGPMRPSNITKLKVFMARGYKMITDQALRSLSDLRLELLDVTGTSVTAKGIHEFLMVNPDCRVVHESICSCS